MSKISVGISSCLLGEKVRYNGGHKQSNICRDELGKYFEFKPICPEMGIGLGVPRKPIRLVGNPDQPRAVGSDDQEFDVTDKLKNFARQTLPELNDICGYIFVKGSPSCGVFRVKVYQESGMPSEVTGSGIYSKMIMENNPQLPVEEAGRLHDPVLKENFITRVFAYRNWQQIESEGLSLQKIVNFHASYKYTLMAHNSNLCKELGRLVADAGKHDADELGQRYFPLFMQTLAEKATRKTNTNVLMHLQGYLKRQLNGKEKDMLGVTISQYRKGVLPIIVPITLLKLHFNNYPSKYIDKQAFLKPYPEDLSLRNQI